jgi:RNA polymerase primary sigma factor
MNSTVYAQYDFATVVDEEGEQHFLRAASLPLLGAQEEQNLAERIAGGDQEAFERLVRANLPWVAKIARHYVRTLVSMEDLIQEGILGLMRAARKYDGRGRFSTYATWWIRQAMIRSIDNIEGIISLPDHISERKRRLQKQTQRLLQELGREPTIAELAEHFDASEELISFLQELGQRLILSLDVPATDDEHLSLRDLLEGSSGAQELTEQQWLLREAMAATCTERERNILTLHYGLDGREPETLLQIGRACGVTRERVRQLEAKALKKIRIFIQERRQG